MTPGAKKKSGIAAKVFSSLFLSLHTTVVCLIILCILVLWGTLYQVDHGIYAAKARFFSAWIVLVGGVLPFPGVHLTALALILNQISMLLFRQQWRLAKAGTLLTHAGILILLVGGGVISYTSRETFLSLWEGESSGESSSYRSWELAIWTKGNGGSPAGNAVVFGLDTLKAGQIYRAKPLAANIGIIGAYRNCEALMPSGMGDSEDRMPLTGIIDSIEAQKPASDPSDNVAGAVAAVAADGMRPTRVVLYGGNPEPSCVPAGTDTLCCAVRQQRTPLPVTVTLIKFVKEDYAGTKMARQFTSTIRVQGSDIHRVVVVSMNKPFRYRHFTFYQSSYSQTGGRQSSTLAVVENRGKRLPYVAGIFMAAGLLLHFCTKLIVHVRNQGAA